MADAPKDMIKANKAEPEDLGKKRMFRYAYMHDVYLVSNGRTLLTCEVYVLFPKTWDQFFFEVKKLGFRDYPLALVSVSEDLEV